MKTLPSRVARFAAIVLVALAAGGCAHPMIISSDVAAIVPTAGATVIPKNVGLYISAENRAKQVTTPGGGGDKVTYKPYADMETGIYKMLSNVFQSVTVLSAPNDSAAIAKNSLSFVVTPEITTSSSSSGTFTWMATDFTVQLTCKITDSSGQSVTSLSSTGQGHAEFAELKSNFSLAGQKASQEALQKMQGFLVQYPFQK